MPAPRKPRSVMELEGNPGGRPLRNEPVAPSGRPKCPSGMPTYTRRCFRHICDALESIGILSTADAGEITIAAQAFADFVTTVKAGEAYHKHAELYHKVASTLGLNPVSRARLVVSAPAPPQTEAEAGLERYGIRGVVG